MENNPIILSLNQKTLDLTLKIYEGNATRLAKQMKNLDARISKLIDKKSKIALELEDVNALINQVAGKATLTPERKEVVDNSIGEEEPQTDIYLSPSNQETIPTAGEVIKNQWN